MLPMYKLYIHYTEKYKEIYGENTVVLLQVGGFYEIYSSGSDIVNIRTIADLCGMIVTKKSKAIPDVGPHNPYMTGFPIEAIQKFLNILISNQYTCIIVSQTGDDDFNRSKTREVTDIVSPSTYMINNNTNNNYLCVLYFEEYNQLLFMGVAGIDVSIGNTFVSETISTEIDKDKAIDELFRILSSYTPNEITLLSNKPISIAKKIEEIVYNYTKSVHPKWDTYYKEIQKTSYQIEMLNKAFQHKSITNIFDIINIDTKQFARIALCGAIQFAYEHNSNIISKLNYPFIVENNNQLIIEYDSILQLNLISNNPNEKSLLKILNNCKTAFGKRAFKDKLLNPITNIDILNNQYNAVDKILHMDFDICSSNLSNIHDLQRLRRRIILHKIVPSEWCNFHISLENIKKLYDYFHYDINPISDSISSLDIDMCSKYSSLNDIKFNIFQNGIYPDIDSFINQYHQSYQDIVSISTKISNLIDTESNLAKVESTKEGFIISITKKRFDYAYSIDKNYMSQFDKKFSNNSKTSYILTNDTINTLSKNMQTCLDKVHDLIIQKYHEFLDTFIEKYDDFLLEIIQTVTDIDIQICIANNTKKWNLSKPIINEYHNSYLTIQGIRNPIIESLDNQYVKNDISIGHTQNGMLLYGINSSGKSSFMKAIGLNIIMAQAGMYCFCDKMEYMPYKHLFTRISGMDNIYRGMSSFVVEMNELRNILNRSDSFSLVLGDEICSGTESVSAVAIVASSLYQLVENKSSFIFATHLHELMNIKIIQHLAIDNILIKHIHVTFKNGKIIYDRKIMDGNGSNVYGIEVCNTLHMPDKFLKMSENIRKEIQNEDSFYVPLKTSSYNSNIYMDLCQICKKNKAVHTHHIKYQKYDTYDKNAKYNLLPLCEICHQKEHSDVYHIEGFVDTSEGKTIQINHNTSNLTHNTITHNTIDYNHLYKYVRYGKCNKWYYRTKETGIFKEIHDEKILLKKLLKLHIYTITDDMKDKLFDLSL